MRSTLTTSNTAMDADVIVIGAGVIGLSIGRRLAAAGCRVLLLERNGDFGRGISSRNSQVIHAGVYYRTGSLKASLCLEGKRLLYEFCERHGVTFSRTGKLFLAIDQAAVPRLDLTRKQALANGVDDLVDLDREAIKRLEPELRGSAALFSPSSGLVDVIGYMRSLLGLAVADGMVFLPDSPVTGGEPIPDGWRVGVTGAEPRDFTGRLVINAAGLHAVELSSQVFPARTVPPFVPTKGSYVKYSGPSPIRHIIYPALIPGQIEERADATPGLDDVLRFGPSVERPQSLDDFTAEANIKERMIPGILRYLPNLDTARLLPDYAGIRPKLHGPKDPVEDFRFEWSSEPGWLDLWGFESPGLTASLAIGEHVHKLAVERGVLA